MTPDVFTGPFLFWPLIPLPVVVPDYGAVPKWGHCHGGITSGNPPPSPPAQRMDNRPPPSTPEHSLLKRRTSTYLCKCQPADSLGLDGPPCALHRPGQTAEVWGSVWNYAIPAFPCTCLHPPRSAQALSPKMDDSAWERRPLALSPLRTCRLLRAFVGDAFAGALLPLTPPLACAVLSLGHCTSPRTFPMATDSCLAVARPQRHTYATVPCVRWGAWRVWPLLPALVFLGPWPRHRTQCPA